MSELKTRPSGKSVRRYLEGIENEVRKKDCFRLLNMMEDVTGKKAKMWGDGIVGFGEYH